MASRILRSRKAEAALAALLSTRAGFGGVDQDGPGPATAFSLALARERSTVVAGSSTRSWFVGLGSAATGGAAARAGIVANRSVWNERGNAAGGAGRRAAGAAGMGFGAARRPIFCGC